MSTENTHYTREAVFAPAILETYISPDGTEVTRMQVAEESQAAMSRYVSAHLGGAVVTGNVWFSFRGVAYSEWASRMQACIDECIKRSVNPAVADAIGALVAHGTTGRSNAEQEPSATVCIGYNPERVNMPIEVFNEFTDAITQAAAGLSRNETMGELGGYSG